MKVHLVDGTYELFRAYYAMPSLAGSAGQPVGAVRGLVQALLVLLRQAEVTHVACAFDHVIESFRNDLFPGYKTGAGVPEDLFAQFQLAERAASALGIAVWPMVEFEADDAMATAASRWWDSPQIDQVVICTPDKDLAQSVKADRVVCLDRRRNTVMDEAGVVEKFGVPPSSIPDYLALVGDPADGIPGIPRWGAKTTARVLTVFGHLENIPDDTAQWGPELRISEAVVSNLTERRDDAMLYRSLATLRLDVPLPEELDQLEWRGAHRAAYEAICSEMAAPGMLELPHRWT